MSQPALPGRRPVPSQPPDQLAAPRQGGPGSQEERQERKVSPTRNVLEWVGIIAGALLVAFVVKTFLIQAFYIPSASMLPTLEEQDRVLVNKLSYDLHDVNRGDIVVFESPPGAEGEIKDLIKRVIGLPGETVEARDGQVLIDGNPIEENYLGDGIITAPMDPTVVPAGHYWVMGDNRGNSRDSRSFGAIDEHLIIGRAFVRVWPLNHLRLF